MRADARMQPAGTSQTVLITAEAPLIETASPTIGSTLVSREHAATDVSERARIDPCRCAIGPLQRVHVDHPGEGEVSV